MDMEPRDRARFKPGRAVDWAGWPSRSSIRQRTAGGFDGIGDFSSMVQCRVSQAGSALVDCKKGELGPEQNLESRSEV